MCFITGEKDNLHKCCTEYIFHITTFDRVRSYLKIKLFTFRQENKNMKRFKKKNKKKETM